MIYSGNTFKSITFWAKHIYVSLNAYGTSCTTESSRMSGTILEEKSRCNGCQENKSKSKRIENYDYFINAKCKRSTPSALRELVKTMSTMPSHTITFAVGVPNVNTFPFQEINVTLKDGSTYKLDGKELETSLQYLPTSGYQPLTQQLQEIQDRIHGPQNWQQQSLMVTCGSSEPIHAAFEMVLSEGDPVIIPVPLYIGVADMFRPLKPKYIGLDQDCDGVRPQQLREILQKMTLQNEPLPKLMYINPTACNPTGRNLSTERKRELYQLACDYNFLIVEDDPYYLIHFMPENPPSLLSMDVEGRVLRMDSFSKILSSGLRLGYVTGPQPLVRQIELYMQVSTLHPSGVSQLLVSKLLQSWGYTNFVQHIEQVKLFYRQRRDTMLAACDRYLKGLAEWDVPCGGMFLWVRVPVLPDTWDLVRTCLERYLLIVPGHPFTGELSPPQYNYVRLSYSLASPSQMDEGVKLLSEIIKEKMKPS